MIGKEKITSEERIKRIRSITVDMDPAIASKDLDTFKKLTKELNGLKFVPGDFEYGISSTTLKELFINIIKHDAGNILEYVLSKRSSYNVRAFEKGSKYSLISIAIINCADECIDAILSSDNPDLNKPGNIIYLTMAARLPLALFKKYFDRVPNDPNKALIEACNNNNVPVAEYLITNKNADPDAEWGTPLLDACSIQSVGSNMEVITGHKIAEINIDLIEMLVNNGASVSLYEYKAVKLAAENHCSMAVLFMLDFIRGRCDLFQMAVGNKPLRELLNHLIYHYISMNDIPMIEKLLIDYKITVSVDAMLYIEAYLIMSKNRHIIEKLETIKCDILIHMNSGHFNNDLDDCSILFDSIMASGSTYMMFLALDGGDIDVKAKFVLYLTQLSSRQKYKTESNSILSRLFEKAVNTNNNDAIKFLKMIGVTEYNVAQIVDVPKVFR